MKIHEQLKVARKEKGWSQQKLADHLSQTPGTREWIANIERGKISPNASTIEKICGILEVKITIQ